MYPKMFDTLARSFTGSNYDIKKLMRAILNSKVYDRRFAETEGSSDPNIAFRTINPMRLSADQIFDNLEWVLGGGLEAGQRFAARRAAVAGGGGPAQRFAVESVGNSVPPLVLIPLPTAIRSKEASRKPWR